MIKLKWPILGRLFLALILAIVFTIFYLQEDLSFKSYLEDKISLYFSKSFNCEFKCKIKKINFFSTKLVLENIYVTEHSENPQWNWRSSRFNIKVYLLGLLVNSKFNLHINLEDIVINSLISSSGELAISDHLKLLMDTTPVDAPVLLKSFYITHGKFNFYNDNLKLGSDFTLNSGLLSKSFKTYIRLFNGYINSDDNFYRCDYIKNLQGDIIHQVYFDNLFDLKTNLKFDLNTPQVFPISKKCLLEAKLNNQEGNLNIISIDKLLNLNLNYSTDTGNIFGDLILGNISTNFINFKDIKINFNKNKSLINSKIEINNLENLKANGAFKWDLSNNNGQLYFKNDFEVNFLENLKILPGDFNIQLNFESLKEFNGNYKLLISDSKMDQNYNFSGNFNSQSSNFRLQGLFNNFKYNLLLNLNTLKLEDFILEDSQNKTVVNLNSNEIIESDGFNIDVNLNYLLIQAILSYFNIDDFTGTGQLNVSAKVEKNILTAQLLMQDANIKIGLINNLLKKLSGYLKLDFTSKKLIISNLNLRLHKGLVACSQAVLNFENLDAPSFIHMPLQFDSLMINIQKDLLATVSGFLVFKYNLKDKSSIKGSIILDKSYLRNNIFASDLQRKFKASHTQFSNTLTNNIELDINVFTNNPTKVKTSFLEANSVIDVKIAGNLLNPLISGQINLIGGSLAFPYKPLFINSGKIYLFPNHLADTSVELHAHQKIKKYDIYLHATGNLTDPHIEFESIPSLTKEQIISLLWAGSEQGSIFMIMPQMAMSNIKKLIFDSEENVSRAQMYLKSIFKPFEKVRFIPDFSDQSGRGGLRGALEVEVNDRLRGMIQKNFSLSEDVKIQVDYDITDQASVRAIRDERGDLGAEVEMRWKF